MWIPSLKPGLLSPSLALHPPEHTAYPKEEWQLINRDRFFHGSMGSEIVPYFVVSPSVKSMTSGWADRRVICSYLLREVLEGWFALVQLEMSLIWMLPEDWRLKCSKQSSFACISSSSCFSSPRFCPTAHFKNHVDAPTARLSPGSDSEVWKAT